MLTLFNEYLLHLGAFYSRPLQEKGGKGEMQNCEIFMLNKKLTYKLTNSLNVIILFGDNLFYLFLSSRGGRIQQILQSDWSLERAEFIHPDRHNERNPSCWSIFVNGLEVIVSLLLFLHFHRRLIKASLSVFTSKWKGKSLQVNSIELF